MDKQHGHNCVTPGKGRQTIHDCLCKHQYCHSILCQPILVGLHVAGLPELDTNNFGSPLLQYQKCSLFEVDKDTEGEFVATVGRTYRDV